MYLQCVEWARNNFGLDLIHFSQRWTWKMLFTFSFTVAWSTTLMSRAISPQNIKFQQLSDFEQIICRVRRTDRQGETLNAASHQGHIIKWVVIGQFQKFKMNIFEQQRIVLHTTDQLRWLQPWWTASWWAAITVRASVPQATVVLLSWASVFFLFVLSFVVLGNKFRTRQMKDLAAPLVAVQTSIYHLKFLPLVTHGNKPPQRYITLTATQQWCVKQRTSWHILTLVIWCGSMSARQS